MSLSQQDVRVLAGQIAASGMAVAKQLPLRNTPAVDIASPFRPSTLAELPRLLRCNDEDPFHHVARLSSAALLYSVNKRSPSQPAAILRGDERVVLNDLHDRRKESFSVDRSCPHCQLLHTTLYGAARARGRTRRVVPPVVSINHSARVNVTFDPETNISEARIIDFQVVVPQRIAAEMIGFSHPLRWADPPGTLFRRVIPVKLEETSARGFRGGRSEVEQEWEALEEGERFIFEDFQWPVNDNLSGSAENVIRIDRFFKQVSAPEYKLRYSYDLQRCVRTNFGVGFEPSGLDIDGGFYEALAIPVGNVGAKKNVDFDRPSERKDATEDRPAQPLKHIRLGHLRKRDMLEIRAHADPKLGDLLVKGVLDRDSGKRPVRGQHTPQPQNVTQEFAPLDDVRETFDTLAQQLEEDWEDLGPFFLVNISASKRLHFTLPQNGPVELWHILTWLAPAVLFTFLNNAVSLAPHMLARSLLKSQ